MSEQIYDIIIAGAGPAGLVLASRLAAASALKILVIESGPPTRNDPLHTQPARYTHHLRPGSKTVHFHTARPSDALGGRAPVVPCGRCVGGGSSVNFAVYTRAAASDYDDWENVHGNRGWSSRDLLPLLRKCETYEIAPDKPTHGYSGPLKVSYGGLFTEVGREFLDVARVYDTTRGETEDVNGLFECNKYGRWQKWIDSKTGKRSDVPHHYIYNRDLPNLHILSGHHVKRVLFTGKRATGVEYVRNPRVHSTSFSAENPKPLIAHARRLVVLSAGALGTPAILERSGIGARDVLAGVGITEPVVDLPGVGENYQDHQVVFAYYKAAPEAHTLDGIARGDEAEIKKWSEHWHRDGSGLLAQNGQDAGIKLRPNAHDLDVIGESFRKRWLSYYAPAPDKPVLWFGVVALYLGDRTKLAQPADDLKAYAVGWFLTHPASTGRTHITSATDVDAPLDLHPGFLDSPEDMALHKWGYKLSREYARRMPSYRGEVLGTGIHPSFAPSSLLATRERDGPVPVDEPEFVYSEEDERALEEWIRANVSTAWHSLGTCAMKAREKGGVADERLNVYGVKGLKVADLSICPANVGANTYSTAIIVGEKAAVIVAEELGIALQEEVDDARVRARL
ncbi:alcohol oxidase-like protein [Lentinus brumalis]|uniref:Alcohol oxidase-like protein n=1 Tax=Lentinus brumalis TaxID=2498619 RepID=A0A371CLB8_9APHY|nr:alcohol oxidase-like protein [Polyporus brumalis]